MQSDPFGGWEVKRQSIRMNSSRVMSLSTVGAGNLGAIIAAVFELKKEIPVQVLSCMRRNYDPFS